MHTWTKKHAKFVGRVIFANFLEIPLERYKDIIEEVDNSSIITVRCLSRANTADEKANRSSKTIARIVKITKGFSIRYTFEGFNKIYTARRNLSPKLFHKIRRINSRNDLTHRIIKGIIERQKKFLSTDDPVDLVPFSQIQLGRWLNGNRLPEIDISWLSRLVNNISVITPSGEERVLKSFFLTQKDINKKLIKQILDEERDALEFSKMRPLSDGEISIVLRRQYGISVSRQSVGICRNDLGIPPARGRLSGYKYPPLLANFSLFYGLTEESVRSNALANSGIYEFRLKGKKIKYPSGESDVIYIGSTKNIKKRLKEHLKENNKNGHIRSFLKRFDCSFRYIQFSKNWKAEEGELYNLFVKTYGAAPKCNRVKPHNDGKRK